MTISFEERLRVSPDTLVNMIADEAVLLNLKSESYFGLDPMAAAMWQALTTAGSIQAAYEQLLDEYEVGAETLRADLNDLVEKLIANELLEIAP